MHLRMTLKVNIIELYQCLYKQTIFMTLLNIEIKLFKLSKTVLSTKY